MTSLKTTIKQALVLLIAISQVVAAGCTTMQTVSLNHYSDLAPGDEVLLTFHSGYKLRMVIDTIDDERISGSGANVPLEAVVSMERREYNQQRTSDRMGETLLFAALFPVCVLIYTGGKYDCTH